MHVQFWKERFRNPAYLLFKQNKSLIPQEIFFSFHRCEASGGRPVPEVSWWNRTHKVRLGLWLVTCNTVGVEVENSWDWRVEHENGTGSAKSEINFVADRHHQASPLSCQVNSRAMKVMASKYHSKLILQLLLTFQRANIN